MRGQIIKIISNLYTVNCNGKIYECHSRGKFRKDNITPVVGDYVTIDEKDKYILEIEERKNRLIRPMVSNIDQGLIITSVKIPDFSTNLLDKLLTLMEINNVEAIICFTKLDLLNEEEKEKIEKYIAYYQKIGYRVYKNDQIDDIKQIFKDKVTVFTGQTGAGKSTLLNRLDAKLNLETGEVSKALGRGKHTTRHVELVELFGGKVLDTPGFSSLEFTSVDKTAIRDAFVEFKDYPCKFKDCMHLNEKECAVRDAVQEGKILESRYNNYKRIVQ